MNTSGGGVVGIYSSVKEKANNVPAACATQTTWAAHPVVSLT